MKLRVITSLLCLAPLVMSDEVKLKDGTIYKDCIIEQETDKNVTITVYVTKTIKDSKTIARDQIDTIVKNAPDENAYAELQRRYGDPGKLGQTDMDKAVKAVDDFIKANPHSKKLADAKKMAEELKKLSEEEEKKEVAAKAEEEAKEPTPEELKRNGYDIEANKLQAKFKSLVKQNNAIGAMVVFDELSREYAASTAYAECREIAAKLLPQFVANVGKMAKAAETKEQETRKAESKKTLELANAARRPGLTPEQRQMANQRLTAWREELTKKSDLHNKKREQFREAIMALSDKKIRWFKPVPELPGSYRDLERIAKSDLDRVTRELQNESDRAGTGSEALKLAWEALDAEKLEEATQQLNSARSARVPREYWEPLDVEIRAAKQVAVEKQRAAREAERAKLLEERRKQQEERNKKSLKDLNDRLNTIKGKDGDKKK